MNTATAIVPSPISEGKVIRPDGGASFILGITSAPGATRAWPDWENRAERDMEALLDWAPDVVVAIDTAEVAEVIDDLADALGDIILETVDMDDAWPVPEEADLKAERREILCHVLANSDRHAGGRILIATGKGEEDAVTLAAEMLMIAGHSAKAARAAVDAIRPGHFTSPGQDAFLADLPEAGIGALGLPFDGGWIVTRASAEKPECEELVGILRADGFHALASGKAFKLSDLVGSRAFSSDPEQRPELSLRDLAVAGSVCLDGGDTLAMLGALAAGFRASMRNGSKERPHLETETGECLHITARIDEGDFRSLP